MSSNLALVAERDRIASGVGLNTVHALFGIGLRLQAISLRQEDLRLARDLDRCTGDLDVVIDELRALVFNLESRNGG